MKPIFNPESLTLATNTEVIVLNQFAELISDFMEGRGDEGRLKTATTAVGVMAKTIQARGNMAQLKFKILDSYSPETIREMLGENPVLKAIEENTE